MRRTLALALVGAVCLLPVVSAPGQPDPPATRSVLVVRLPHPEAKLTVDGTVVKGEGAERKFVTPRLAGGKKYTYDVVAVWGPNNYTTITRKRKVVFVAGTKVVVDLTKEDPKQRDAIVVVYVPTPQKVVEAMCRLGKVGKNDVVYDLGCGDGRLVITAVSKFGAKRGVGVDIDQERIKESRANARAAKVEEKVEFRQQDVLKIADLKDATVVMLYMGEDLNLRLRPILQKTLRPGARVVSHRFLMGDWKPEKTEVVRYPIAGQYRVHLWTIGKK
jgi:uncharacterized protein (TIGR03000 family)